MSDTYKEDDKYKKSSKKKSKRKPKLKPLKEKYKVIKEDE